MRYYVVRTRRKIHSERREKSCGPHRRMDAAPIRLRRPAAEDKVGLIRHLEEHRQLAEIVAAIAIAEQDPLDFRGQALHSARAAIGASIDSAPRGHQSPPDLIGREWQVAQKLGVRPSAAILRLAMRRLQETLGARRVEGIK